MEHDHSATLAEWTADWKLAGKAASTVRSYCYVLAALLAEHEALSLPAVKAWIAEAESTQLQRYRGRAARAFCSWATEEDVMDCSWWKRIPLANVAEAPQETV